MHCRSRKEQRAAAAADLELSVGVEGGGRRGICGQRGRIRSCGGAGNRWGKAAAGEGAPDRGEGALDRGGEGRPEGIGLSIGAAQATGGEGRRRCGRRRSLAEGRSDGGRRRSPGGGKERRRKTTARAISNRWVGEGQFGNFTHFHLVGKPPPTTIISERREYVIDVYFTSVRSNP